MNCLGISISIIMQNQNKEKKKMFLSFLSIRPRRIVRASEQNVFMFQSFSRNDKAQFQNKTE